MGIVRMGGVIKFIPYPMTVGFTSGIALIIGVSQFKDFLGLTVPSGSAGFLHQLVVYAANLGTVTPWSVVIGLLSLGIMLLWPRLTRKIPGSLVAIITATLLVKWFAMPVETIGTKFGEVTSMLPTPRLPAFEWQILPALEPHALTIAILGGIESLLFAVVADGMTGRRHRSNTELIAQGVANVVTLCPAAYQPQAQLPGQPQTSRTVPRRRSPVLYMPWYFFSSWSSSENGPP
jgi:SulP family sulfate permease